jgi:hypothetical protein
MKLKCFGVVLLFVFGTLIPPIILSSNVLATNRDIGKNYSSIDIVNGSMLVLNSRVPSQNSYDFYLKSLEQVDYAVEVMGAGSVEVLLVIGNDPTYISNYLVDYSTKNAVRTFSKTFKNEAKYNSKNYSIMIMNSNDANVTYKITITVYEDVVGNTVLIIGGLFLIFGIPIIVLFIRKYMRHTENKQKQEAKICEWPCSVCGKPLSYIEPNKQWYCENCRKYF